MSFRSARARGRIIGVFALGAAALSFTGCVFRGTTSPSSTRVGTAEIASASLDRDIYNSPSARYDDRTVYFYNGRWMYRDNDTWKYYTKEPPELYRHRTQTRRELPPRQAPPAPRDDQQPTTPDSSGGERIR